jgi:hypothetical protein
LAASGLLCPGFEVHIAIISHGVSVCQ